MASPEKKHIQVVAAAIFQGDAVFCFKKGADKFPYLSKKFEFPGGKINGKEKKEVALSREIKEELDVEIVVKEEILTVDHVYPDFSLTMTCFRCNAEHSKFKLNEHLEVKLVHVSKLLELEWLAADLPIVKEIMEMHGG